MNKKKRLWIISNILGIISSIIIISTYLKQPEDIDYAGSRFAYNISFYFPLFFLSLIFGLIGLIYFIKYIRSKEPKSVKYRILKAIAPIIFLIPIFLHVVTFTILLVKAFMPIRYPGVENAHFTTHKVFNESVSDTLYFHAGMYGDLYRDQIVYLTDLSLSKVKENNTKVLKYEGKWRNFFLYYQNDGDTLKIYVPKGQIKDTSLFHTPVLLQQFECTEEEKASLRELFLLGELDLVYFEHDY